MKKRGINDYSSCMTCTGRVCSINDTLGKCEKCDATVKLSEVCKTCYF